MSKTPQDTLRETPPITGRQLAEDGTIVNVAEQSRRTLLSIWRGDFPGAGYFGSNGEMITAGAILNAPLWSGGATLPSALPVGVQMSVVSTETTDTAAGTGARVIYITYMDNMLDPVTVFVVMDGTTPVSVNATDMRWIQEVGIVNAGDTRAADGDITVSYDGTTYGVIKAGAVIQTSSFRMVPRGLKAQVNHILLSAAGFTTDTRAIIRTVVQSNGLLVPGGSIGLQNGGISTVLEIGYPLLPGTILGLSVDTNNVVVATGMFIGWTEPYSG